MTSVEWNPKRIDDNTWFYLDTKGVLIVHEVRDSANEYLKTDMFTIPWVTVRAALRRYDDRKRKK